jgi:hypothetical protein
MKTILRLLTIVACAASSACFTTSALAQRYSESEKSSQSYPLAAHGTLRLSNVNGAVDVAVWDKNEVLVETEKRAATTADLARIHIVVDAQPDRLVVKTDHEKTGFFGISVRGEVRYHLKVPAGISIEKISVVNSTVTVQGVRGSVVLETVNGSIHATDLGADAKLETVNGSIHAAFATVSASQRITTDSVNGACELTLPANAGAHVDLSTINGSTHCDFPVTIEQSSRRTLRGTIGGGGATVRADTVNGSIRLVKL